MAVIVPRSEVPALSSYLGRRAKTEGGYPLVVGG